MTSKHSLLWEFNHKESGSGYLFGSIHINNELVQSIFTQIKPYIITADIVAAEIHLDEVDQSFPEKYFNLPEGDSYQKHWSRTRMIKYEFLIKKILGVSLRAHEHLNPIILFNLLSLKMIQGNLSSSNFDEMIWTYSKGIGKAMFGLESLNYHFEHLQKVTIKDQFKMLNKAFRNSKMWRRQLLNMVELYKHQETVKLYHSTKRQLGSLRRPFLYERNFTLVNALDKLVKSGRVFASVGVAHFDGQFGMLKLLKDKNYKLNPIILEQTM